MKDSRGKKGEYEQLRYIIDQKDATIAEKDQLLRQCREELNQKIQQIQQKNQQQSRQIQQLEREKRQIEHAKNQIIEEKERQLDQQLERNERLIADFGKQNIELEKELRVVRSRVQGKDCGAKAGAVSRTDFKLRCRWGKRHHVKWILL